jgi:hypothetical protein
VNVLHVYKSLARFPMANMQCSSKLVQKIQFDHHVRLPGTLRDASFSMATRKETSLGIALLWTPAQNRSPGPEECCVHFESSICGDLWRAVEQRRVLPILQHVHLIVYIGFSGPRRKERMLESCHEQQEDQVYGQLIAVLLRYDKFAKGG